MPVTFSDIVSAASMQLTGVSATPALDAEILLAHVLAVSRAHLFAWPEKEISASDYQKFFILLEKACAGVPVACLTERREFWSLSLRVTQATLVPRPETELLVEKTLAMIHRKNAVVAECGTGSGAIAIALAHERPHWQVYATDISVAALEIAAENARRLVDGRIVFSAGDWCTALPPLAFDAIVSNPPYIAIGDPHLAALQHEPEIALVSGTDGLDAIQTLIATARGYLKPAGWLLLEHGATQDETVRTLFLAAGFAAVQTFQDLAGHARVTVGQSQTAVIKPG